MAVWLPATPRFLLACKVLCSVFCVTEMPLSSNSNPQLLSLLASRDEARGLEAVFLTGVRSQREPV